MWLGLLGNWGSSWRVYMWAICVVYLLFVIVICICSLYLSFESVVCICRLYLSFESVDLIWRLYLSKQRKEEKELQEQQVSHA